MSRRRTHRPARNERTCSSLHGSKVCLSPHVKSFKNHSKAFIDAPIVTVVPQSTVTSPSSSSSSSSPSVIPPAADEGPSPPPPPPPPAPPSPRRRDEREAAEDEGKPSSLPAPAVDGGSPPAFAARLALERFEGVRGAAEWMSPRWLRRGVGEPKSDLSGEKSVLVELVEVSRGRTQGRRVASRPVPHAHLRCQQLHYRVQRRKRGRKERREGGRSRRRGAMPTMRGKRAGTTSGLCNNESVRLARERAQDRTRAGLTTRAGRAQLVDACGPAWGRLRVAFARRECQGTRRARLGGLGLVVNLHRVRHGGWTERGGRSAGRRAGV